MSRQGAFYALLLWAAQEVPWRAVAHILPAKRERAIPIEPALVEQMVDAAETLEQLAEEPAPPRAEFTAFCSTCSYRHLCGAA